MDTQSIIALSIVAVTAGIFVWKLSRRKGASGCAGGCGCAKPAANLRRR